MATESEPAEFISMGTQVEPTEVVSTGTQVEPAEVISTGSQVPEVTLEFTARATQTVLQHVPDSDAVQTTLHKVIGIAQRLEVQ